MTTSKSAQKGKKDKKVSNGSTNGYNGTHETPTKKKSGGKFNSVWKND